MDAIYDAMRSSKMANWVGQGDPASVGDSNFRAVVENFPLKPTHHVYDFGCGIGRASVRLAEALTEGVLVGSDIVPGQIKFCQENISPHLKNASFYCLDAKNPLYEKFSKETAGTADVIPEDKFFSEHRDEFDLIVAFSVFTHFTPHMAQHYLKNLANLTKPGGYLLLTWFIDSPANPSHSRLEPGQHFRERDPNLDFVLFSFAAIQEFAVAAGLYVERITYGNWRGRSSGILKGQHYQDAVILRRPILIPAEFDSARYLEIHRDVKEAGIDPKEHYLSHGWREGRQLK